MCVADLETKYKELQNALEEQILENKKLKSKLKKALVFVPRKDNSHVVREEFSSLTSSVALQKLLDDYEFDSVLDIGAGELLHSQIFANYGKSVTAIDLGTSIYYDKSHLKEHEKISKIIGNFYDISFEQQFDLIWLSHVLEHQVNPGTFLDKVISLAKENGIIAITVPPLKHNIVGGHVSLWNAGLILYRLVLAKIDCRDAIILSYGYNISVIVRKKTIEYLPELQFDAGDIKRIRPYLPDQLDFKPNSNDDPFDGNIKNLNWK